MENLFSYKDEELFFHHSLDPVPQPSAFVAHTHDMFELYYCISGSGVFHVEGNAYPLRDGMLMLMRPTESHYTEIDPAHPYHRMALHFRQELLPSDSSDILLRPGAAAASPSERNTAASPPAKAQTVVDSAPDETNRMANAAPTLAPEETPMMSGLARGLRNTVW